MVWKREKERIAKSMQQVHRMTVREERPREEPRLRFTDNTRRDMRANGMEKDVQDWMKLRRAIQHVTY